MRYMLIFARGSSGRERQTIAGFSTTTIFGYLGGCFGYFADKNSIIISVEMTLNGYFM